MNALFHILNGIENGNLTLRATHYQYLNDKSECRIFEKYYIDKYKENNIIEYYDFKIDSTILHETFIISFSEKYDNLTMWRLYSKNNGVSLSFNFQEALESSSFVVSKCHYISNIDDFDIVAKQSIISTSSSIYYAFNPLHVSSIIKHPSFKDESEYRILYQPLKKDVKFFEKDGLIKPYIDIQIPVTALKQIWLAPGCDEELSRKSILMLLESKGVTHITENDIIHSKHPYIDR
ncbi:MAG: DUF2971 domain-containing protein [Sarcina sp.]